MVYDSMYGLLLKENDVKKLPFILRNFNPKIEKYPSLWNIPHIGISLISLVTQQMLFQGITYHYLQIIKVFLTFF